MGTPKAGRAHEVAFLNAANQKSITSGKKCERGTCCKENGEFILAEQRKVCTVPLSECNLPTTCDGTSAHCPEHFKADGTLCGRSSKTCSKGQCKDSVCFLNNYLDCHCKDNCEVCCQKAANESCQQASDLGLRTNNNTRYVRKFAELCMDKHGYCNEEARCVHFLTTPILYRLNNDVTTEIHILLIRNWMLFVAIALSLLYVAKKMLFQKAKDDKLLLQRFFAEVKNVKITLPRHFPKAHQASRYMEDGRVHFSRMLTLFPTVPLEILADCVGQIGIEEEIVKMLLSNGVPVRYQFKGKFMYPESKQGIIMKARKKSSSSTEESFCLSRAKRDHSTEETVMGRLHQGCNGENSENDDIHNV